MCTSSYQKLRKAKRNTSGSNAARAFPDRQWSELMVTRFVERCECASNADRSNIACWPDCGCLDQLADFPYLFWIWSGDCSRL